MIDVEQARRDIKATIVLHGAISAAGMTAGCLLCILDAFEAMERECWTLWFWKDYKDRTENDSWSVEPVGGDGPCIAEASSPLAALLAATETLTNKPNEVNDGD